MTHNPMVQGREVIDVDDFEPEVEIIGETRRISSSILLHRSRMKAAAQKPSNVHDSEVIDLTLDDPIDDNIPTPRPASSASVGRGCPPSSSKNTFKFNAPPERLVLDLTKSSSPPRGTSVHVTQIRNSRAFTRVSTEVAWSHLPQPAAGTGPFSSNARSSHGRNSKPKAPTSDNQSSREHSLPAKPEFTCPANMPSSSRVGWSISESALDNTLSAESLSKEPALPARPPDSHRPSQIADDGKEHPMDVDDSLPDYFEDVKLNMEDENMDVDEDQDDYLEEDWEYWNAAFEIDNPDNWGKHPTSGAECTSEDYRKQLEQESLHAADNAIRAIKQHRSLQIGSRGIVEQVPALARVPCRNTRSLVWDRLGPQFNFGASRRRLETLQGGRDRFSGLSRKEYAHLLPGAVSSITQSGAFTAIVSCVEDGAADEEPANAPYNRPGTFVLLHNDRVVHVDGHRARKKVKRVSRNAGEEREAGEPKEGELDGEKPTEGGLEEEKPMEVEFEEEELEEDALSNDPTRFKYYSISEALFVPPIYDEEGRTLLLSCGEDQKLIQWDCTSVPKGGQPIHLQDCSYLKGWIPRGMALQPGRSLLAVCSSEGQVYLQDGLSLERLQVLNVAPREYARSVQDFAWGTDSTVGRIYATSALAEYDKHEPLGYFGGYHRGFDLATGKVVVSLQNERGGDALALHPRGDQAALATSSMITAETGYDFELALYDVARDYPRAIATISLNGWPSWPPTINGSAHYHQPCVNTISYSPDGIYLAVGRSDNKTEVYDSRFLSKGPVYEFKHADPPVGLDSDGLFGVAKAEWLRDSSDRLQLVTSGADGCVRLWDVHNAKSRVVAETASYVSWFSVGDPLKGEKPLILGGGDGDVVLMG